MKKWIAFLCAAAVMTGALAGCGAQSQQSSENGTTEQAATDASGDLSGLSDKFGAAVKQNEFEGVAYAAQNGEKLFESESGQGYNAETVYHIASLSKQFTAAAVLLLEEEGRLSVDDTLDKYFPDYSGGDTVKLHHLLCMRSGIADYTDAMLEGAYVPESIGVTADNSADENRAAMETWILENTTPAPDLNFTYSNTNYFLLAEVIEKVSGESYEDYINEKIISPLGMNSTGFGDTWNKTDLTVASGMGETKYAFVTYPAAAYGSGDMMSTAKDLTIWANEFINGKNKVLSDSIITKMTANYENAGYGYGVMLDENHGIVHHAGNLPPFTTYLSVDRETGFVLVLLDNAEDTSEKDVMQQMNKDYYAAKSA